MIETFFVTNKVSLYYKFSTLRKLGTYDLCENFITFM